MLNKIKTLIAATSAALILALGGFGAVALAADPPSNPGNGNPGVNIEDNTCQGSNLDFQGTAGANACKRIAGDSTGQANSLVARIINIFSVVVGVVSVIMIIYGGFRYVTSGGESTNITSAKNTILYAIIGLIIVALAQFIVKFVLAKATGQENT